MGGPGGYEGDVEERSSSTCREHFRFEGHTGNPRQPERREVHPDLNPKGVKRECCDLPGQPPRKPIAVVMDVTRSRGKDAMVIYGKLPMFFGQLVLHDYLRGMFPSISFAAVGDATCGDQAPAQVGQFENDNRLDDVLSKIWLEEGGGGTGQESYELLAYFYATKSILDCTKRGEKGYLFFLGDEGFYPKVSRDQVKVLIGDNIPEDIPSEQIFAKLQELYDVFFIYPKKSWEDRKADIDEEIKKRLIDAGGRFKDVDIRASLSWNTFDDLDLHMICPSGEEIFYNNRRSRCSGELDVDRNAGGRETRKPVENIRYPKGQAPDGDYHVFVRNFAYHDDRPGPIDFRVELDILGKIQHFDGRISPNRETGPRSDITAFRFNFKRANQVDVKEGDKYALYDDTVIKNQWSQVIPAENILIIDDPKGIVDVMLGAIAVNEGLGLEDYEAHMQERGQTSLRRRETVGALESFATSKKNALAPVGVASLINTTGGSDRKGKSKRL